MRTSLTKGLAILMLWLAMMIASGSRLSKRCQRRKKGICRTSAILTKSFGSFHSPGYPKNYSDNSQSMWYIRVSKGYRIKLRLRRDFQIEDSTLCHKDALIISFDQTQKNKKLLCGMKRQRGVTSSTNELWVMFRSNDAITAKGFYATYRAIDVNECKREVCKFPSLCRNTVGSYMCDCPNGYKLRGRKNSGRCVDINECSDSQMKCEFKCVNTAGSYYCTCPRGYKLAQNEKSCRDVNECLKYNGGCSHQCRNFRGSYNCICPPGYKLDKTRKICHKEIFYDNYQQIYYIKENANIGTLVTKIKTKLKKRRSRKILFSIITENLKTKSTTFKMNRTTGELRVNDTLDREKTAEYLLEIEVKHLNERRKWTKAKSYIVVRLLDVNDNVPRFGYPAYTITVPCNVKPGSIIYRIGTYDADEGKNARVIYKLEPKNLYFTVQKHSGKVKVLKGLRAFCNGSLSLPMKIFNYKIVAKDRGTPTLSSSVNVCFIIAGVDLTSQSMFVWYTENHDVKLIQKSSRKSRDPDDK